jgi:glycosyltransferase involved in cell wall biosynthesis
MEDSSSSIRPAIVIAAYDRPNSLSRLLSMILAADYSDEGDASLVISIDGGGDDEVVRIANEFEWPFGAKKIIEHSKNLGLREHILNCGDLTERYGAIIMLEDDLLISPSFYQFAVSGVNSTAFQNPDVVGLSLYNYRVNETSLVRFYPIEDGYDNYYLQVPSSWGQVWTANQWSRFREWYRENEAIDFTPIFRNRVMAAWGHRNNGSWKRYYAAYMILGAKYMLYPRKSYSDNSGDVGENHVGEAFYRTPLVFSDTGVFRFSELQESVAVYDQNFELDSRVISSLYPDLNISDFCVFLNDSELILENAPPQVLTRSKSLSARSWGNVYYPIELNLILNVPGVDISFVELKEVERKICTHALLSNEKLFGLKNSAVFFFRKLCDRIICLKNINFGLK